MEDAPGFLCHRKLINEIFMKDGNKSVKYEE